MSEKTDEIIDNQIIETDDEFIEIMDEDIMMKKITPGEGPSAEMTTTVVCNLKGFLLSNPPTSTSENIEKSTEEKQRTKLMVKADEPFEVSTFQKFKIGEGDAFPGLEMALRHSHIGQKLEMRCSARFAFGDLGRPKVVDKNLKSPKTHSKHNKTDIPVLNSEEIPPNSALHYEIEILNHLPEGSVEPSLLEDTLKPAKSIEEAQSRLVALTEMNQRKEAGNRWFSFQDYTRAARAYAKATKVADTYFNKNNQIPGMEDSSPIEEEDWELLEVHINCLNNLAACQLQLNQALKAKDLCIQVLQFRPNNLKALLRAAKASLQLQIFDECDLCINRLLAVCEDYKNNKTKLNNPDTDAEFEKMEKSALIEQKKLIIAKKEYAAQSKKMANNIAKKLFDQGKNTKKPQKLPKEVINAAVEQEKTELKIKNEIENESGNESQNEIEKIEKAKDTIQAVKKASGNDSGILLLLGTSVGVLILSVVIVFFYRDSLV